MSEDEEMKKTSTKHYREISLELSHVPSSNLREMQIRRIACTSPTRSSCLDLKATLWMMSREMTLAAFYAAVLRCQRS